MISFYLNDNVYVYGGVLDMRSTNVKTVGLNCNISPETIVRLEIIVNRDWRTYHQISFDYAKYIISKYKHRGYLIQI